MQQNFEGARSQVGLLAELNATLLPEPEGGSAEQLANVERENEEVVENQSPHNQPTFYSQWEGR